jgi:hypothetical protein
VRGQSTLVVELEIAGTACRVACDDARFGARLAERYRDFAPASEPPISLDVTLTAQPSYETVASWSGPYARVTGRGSVLAIEGLGFTGAFDEATGRGTIRQPADPEPLETLLTGIYASRLLRTGGFMLHAAAIVATSGALVFFGPSGSGKTTVSELVGEGVLTDEITAIRPHGRGYLVSSVPWRGQALAAPLAGLFRLRQATRTSITPLSPLETVRQLLPSVFFARADAGELGRFLETAETLARSVRGWDMAFTRDRSFWDVVPGAA